MSHRVLIVDDDRLLLSSLERNLMLDYQVCTADDGPQALALLRERHDYAVVITDMRMPGMDGIETITEARKVSPQSTYVMLTGNQDVGTAMQAVNEGQVFRFLTKPCEIGTIKKAIEAGIRQYDLVTAERTLLTKTVAGAIGMLTDVLAAARPELYAKLGTFGQSIGPLRQALRMGDHWEYQVAARLSLVGFACLSDRDAARFLELHPNTPEWREIHQRSAEIAGRLLWRIPRLQTVSSIIAGHPHSTGEHCHSNPKTEAAVVQTGATLLQVAFLWDALTSRGLGHRQAIADLREILPRVMPDYIAALEELPTLTHELVGAECTLSRLLPDMVLSRDVCATDGTILLRSGSRLTDVSIERLRDYNDRVTRLRPVQIVQKTMSRETVAADADTNSYSAS